MPHVPMAADGSYLQSYENAYENNAYQGDRARSAQPDDGYNGYIDHTGYNY